MFFLLLGGPFPLPSIRADIKHMLQWYNSISRLMGNGTEHFVSPCSNTSSDHRYACQDNWHNYSVETCWGIIPNCWFPCFPSVNPTADNLYMCYDNGQNCSLQACGEKYWMVHFPVPTRDQTIDIYIRTCALTMDIIAVHFPVPTRDQTISIYVHVLWQWT